MPVVTFPDAEDIAKEWLTGTTVAPLVMVNGRPMIFQAMPKGSPIPVIVLSRVGGGPVASDVPYDSARISFDIFASNRPQAKVITKTLIAELESVDRVGHVDTSYGRLESAQTLSEVWLPDPASDTSRYVVDALLIVRSI